MKKYCFTLLFILVYVSVIGQTINKLNFNLRNTTNKTTIELLEKLESNIILLTEVNSNMLSEKLLDSLISISFVANQKDRKKEYFYDGNRNLTKEVWFVQETNLNQWKPEIKLEWNYNSGEWSDLTLYLWDGFQWDAWLKRVNTYDSQGNIVLLVNYEWKNQWVKYHKAEFNYDSGNLKLEYQYLWDIYSSDWKPEIAIDYQYLSNGKLEVEIHYNYVGSDKWTANTAILYEYNSNYNLKSETNLKYDEYSKNWENETAIAYSYDDSGNKIKEMNYEWTYTWQQTSKIDYTYDSDNYVSEANNFNWELINGNFIWNKTINDKYFYSNSSLGIDDELLANSINLYPNPAINILTINSKSPIIKVEIYSILGKKINEIKPSFNTISIEDLSKGLYLIRLFSENNYTVKKIFKQ